MKKGVLAIAALLILGIGILAGVLFVKKNDVLMNINKPMNINIKDDVPLSVGVDENIGIKLLSDLKTQINVDEPLSIYLNEVIDVPLVMNLTVPLNTDILMDEVLDLQFDLPVDIVLDQSEIGLNNLVIPFNKKLKIEDSLAVDFSIPLDTKIRTNFKRFFNISLPVKAEIPVKVNIPINQQLQVRDTLVLDAQDYTIPFKTTIPVKAKVPIKQKVHIEGELEVPVSQTVSIPLKKLIKAPVTQPFTAEVKTLNDNIETSFNTDLKTTAKFDKSLRVSSMDSLIIDPTKVKFTKKEKE